MYLHTASLSYVFLEEVVSMDIALMMELEPHFVHVNPDGEDSIAKNVNHIGLVQIKKMMLATNPMNAFVIPPLMIHCVTILHCLNLKSFLLERNKTRLTRLSVPTAS